MFRIIYISLSGKSFNKAQTTSSEIWKCKAYSYIICIFMKSDKVSIIILKILKVIFIQIDELKVKRTSIRSCDRMCMSIFARTVKVHVSTINMNITLLLLMSYFVHESSEVSSISFQIFKHPS